MSRKLLISTVAAAALLTGSALADCQDDIKDLNADMATGGELALGMRDVGGQDVRKLRDAAYIFASHGDEEACEELIEDVRELLADKQEVALEQWEEEQEEMQEQAYLESLESAQPIASIDRPIQVQTLVGKDLRNHRDEELGEVDAVIVAGGGKQVTHILVSHGGLFGIGTEQVAVPWEHVDVTEDGGVLVLHMEEDVFDEAPSIDRDDDESLSNADWSSTNSAYFDQHVM